MTAETYSPGSDEAVAKGCTCPVSDNARGQGLPGGQFWISEGCPLHAPAAPSWAYDEPFDGDEFGPDGEDGDDWDDCGLMADGQCTKAGSEECDWDCGRLHR